MGFELLVPDFRSALRYGDCGLDREAPAGPAVLGLRSNMGFAAGIDSVAAEAALAGGASLVRVADGAAIAGEVRSGWFNVSGEEVDGVRAGWSFVPAEPLEPGWHVLRFDLTELEALGQHIVFFAGSSTTAHSVYARFRVDSVRSWVFTRVACQRRDHDGLLPAVEQACNIGGAISEAAIVDWGSTSMIVRYDDQPVECAPISLGDSWFSTTCPLPPSTDVRVDVEVFSDAIAGPNGEARLVHGFDFIDLPRVVELPDWWQFDQTIPVAPSLGLELR
ncbi:MAG: hypothetical protein IPF99_35435 [Deltaproteobacteria bacterium]|nr:hypothetical protein [Deltaproteobacteria bacterium]